MPDKLVYAPVDYDPFEGVAIEKAGFTNESQKEIYLSCIIGGEDANRAYNESFSLRLFGKTDPAILQSAVDDLVMRHEALRSTFSSNGEYVFVARFAPVSILFENISMLAAENQQELIRQAALANVTTAFDLQNGPLFTVQLWKVAPDEHYLTLNVHHIIGDGWSIGVMLQDLGRFYSTRTRGEQAGLPPAPQMLQYARDEQELIQAPEYRVIQDFWLSLYKNTVPKFDLPTDFPRPPYRTYKSHRLDYVLNGQLTRGIKELARQASGSFVTTLVVAFEVFLYTISRQKDIILGLPAAGQAVTGNTGLVGHCVNLLPLKSSPDGRSSFIDYLGKRKLEILDAFENQRVTFGSLLKELNIPRDASRVTLVPVVFNVDMGLDNDVEFEGLTYQLVSNPRKYETFEVFVNISGTQEQLTAEWSYNTQLFKAETIGHFHRKFEHLLEQVVATPQLLIDDLSLFEQTEAERVSAVLNDTAVAYPEESTLHELISATAKEYPGNIALSFKGREITYAELDKKTNQLAHALLAAGLKRGDKAGVSVDRTPEMLFLLLAVIKTGAAFLPLDPAYPTARIRAIMENVNAPMLLTSETHLEKYGAGFNTVLTENLLQQLDSYPESAPANMGNSSDPVYVLHTSGSTGQPKGVEVTHKNVVNLFFWMLNSPGIGTSDTLLAITSISFDIAYVELFLPLLAGAKIVLADEETARDGRLILQQIAQEQITILQATPATWKMLLASGWTKKYPLKAITGGEALSIHLAKALLAVCGELWNIYGPTETTIYSTGKKIAPADDLITIGKPVNNTQVYLLDERMQRVPQGVEAEIYIAGHGVSNGYINKAELTAERFIDNPYGEPGSRLYKTGDLGKLLPDGEILCLGRSDQQIKIRGFRIEPQEIEHHLAKMPGVKEVVVTGIATNADTKLVAFVVPEDGNTDADPAEPEAWREKLKELVPEYMVPQQIIYLAGIPLTPNQKVDKSQLELFVSQNDQGHSHGFFPPQTSGQQLIAAIWKELLDLDIVSIRDNFFELGGHSLIAVSVMVRIEHETGIRLPISTLFENSSIEKLAQLIETEHAEVKWNSLVPIKPNGSKTPVYIIHGSGLNVFMFHSLINYIDGDRPLYGIQAIGLDGTDFEISSLEQVASIYIDDMLADNPSGPYALVGYSLGGMIALEMAKQLKAKGKKVIFLGMIDTYVDNVSLFDARSMKLVKKVIRQFPKLWFIAKSFVKHPKDAFLYQLHIAKVKVRKVFGHEDKLIAAGQSFQERIYDKYDKAYYRYKLTAYDDKIHLFKVKKRIYYLDDSKYLGWKPFAPAGLVVRDLPGDHKTFILPPFDKSFAAILEEAVGEVELSLK